MREDVTYWPRTGQDEFGQPVFDPPQLLKGRWEDRSDVIRNKHGDEYVSKARVFVTDEIQADGFLYRGATDEETPPEGSLEIQAHARIPDLRTVTQLNVAYL